MLALTVAAGCSSSAPSAPAPPAPAATSSEVTGIAPKNAIVTLLPAAAPLPMPTEPAILDQYAKQFVPTVLIVRVGQPVEFRNSEDMPHNVSVIRQSSGVELLNVGTEPHQKHVYTFDRVGKFDVRCDIHEGMEATIIAARGPVTTIAEDDGRFSFPNVAFGSYLISVSFEGRTVEQALEVTAARTNVKLAQ
jgi:plastocyanin